MSSAQALNLQTVAEDREDHDGDMTQPLRQKPEEGLSIIEASKATSYLSPL